MVPVQARSAEIASFWDETKSIVILESAKTADGHFWPRRQAGTGIVTHKVQSTDGLKESLIYFPNFVPSVTHSDPPCDTRVNWNNASNAKLVTIGRLDAVKQRLPIVWGNICTNAVDNTTNAEEDPRQKLSLSPSVNA